jgi:putative oxidoreductase
MPFDAFAVLARLLLASVFLPNGILKLSDPVGTAGYFESLGFPAPLAVAVATGLFELIGGLAIVTGFQTRAAAFLLGAFCIAAGLTGHLGQGGDDPTLAFMHLQALLKDVGLAGGFLALAIAGPGRFSLDGARRN